jgi:hypothetical protein
MKLQEVKMLEKQPFVRYTEGEKPKNDVVPVWLSKEERVLLEEAKKFLRQPKDSTTLKQLFIYGYKKLIGEESNRFIISRIIKNEYLNRKSGAFVETPKEEESNRNLPEI